MCGFFLNNIVTLEAVTVKVKCL